MNDWALRQALLAGPLAPEALGPGERVVQEVVLTGGRVVDLLHLRPGSLHAWELKGEGDRLGRLPGQAEAYQACCHRLHLVCSPRHLALARAQLPSWWGLWVGEAGALRLHRPAQGNPFHRPEAVVSLLSVPELRAGLRLVQGAAGLARAKRAWLLRAWAEALGPEEAHALAVAQLMGRQPWGKQAALPGRGRAGGPLQAVTSRGPSAWCPHPKTGEPERRRVEQLACGHEVEVVLRPFTRRAQRRRCPWCRDEGAPPPQG